MNKQIIKLITVGLLYFTSLSAQAQDSWRFINIPDYHNAEGFAKNTPERDKRIADQTKMFAEMKDRYGGELIVIPGDCNSGHWYQGKFLKPFKKHPDYTNYSKKEVVLEASRLCYEGLRSIIHDGGYEHVLMAVGDHELGDNPWRKGSEVVKHIPAFRQGFAATMTMDEKGNSLFNEKIGKANARPLGTIYEHTSHAVQYKNVLFVTLDIFRFDGADITLGDQGVIKGDIAGAHLEWFESVLREAQNLPSIKHIVVQSHLPAIYPVRKYASSGMMIDRDDSEKFLNVLRKYKVDLYLAGEVHMNTVTQDAKSDLIQLVARGNNLSNMTMVDVEDDKLNLTTYHWNGDIIGSLSIDKSKDETAIAGTGLLSPIRPDGLQIYWSFDELTPNTAFKSSVDGTFPKAGKHNPMMESKAKTKVFLNDGGFNTDYSLMASDADMAKGVIGNAAEINSHSRLFVLPIGPMDYGYERTLACWVKTTANGRRLIFNSASYWGKTGQFFNLSLYDGNFEVSLRPDIHSCTQNLHLNDGEWHHIAAVVPRDDALLHEVKLYVDGHEIENKTTSKPKVKVNTSQANWMAIATQIAPYKTDLKATMDMDDYVGLLDDFCIWTRALNADDIKTIYTSGKIGMSALELE